MADAAEPVLDPILEAELRRTLRAEADAIPFRVTAAGVRAAAAARASARRRRLPVVLAASLALVAVGATAIAVATREPGGVGATAGMASAALAPFDRLLEVSTRGRELARGEGVTEAGATILAVPTVPGFHAAEVVFSCTGSPITLTAGANGVPVGGHWGGPRFDCTGGQSRTWIPGPAAEAVAAGGLRIAADPGTAWRAIVVGLPDAADVIAGTAPVPGLPSFEELAAADLPSLPEVARASAPATLEGTFYRVLGLGEAAAMQSVIACRGGPLTLVWATGPGWSTSQDGGAVPCEEDAFHLAWNRQPPAADASELHVYAPAGTAWIMLVEDTSGPETPVPAP